MKQWLSHDGKHYPAGRRGELAVGYYRDGEELPELVSVSTREAAEKHFQEFLKSAEPMHVVLDEGPNEGRRSAVVFVVRCDGGTNWTVIKETEGTKQEFPNGRLPMPDLEYDEAMGR
jgi:hypothetical protein